jgi:site-specific recombinase XerD
VPLVGDAHQALLDQRDQQLADREASPHWTNPAGYVFTTESGEPVDPSNLGRWFATIRQSARLRDGAGTLTGETIPSGSWHTLRHSAASTLLRAGTPMLVVSRLLGHSKVQITLDLYGHLTTSDIAEAVAVGFTGYGKASGPDDNVVSLRSVASGL